MPRSTRSRRNVVEVFDGAAERVLQQVFGCLPIADAPLEKAEEHAVVVDQRLHGRRPVPRRFGGRRGVMGLIGDRNQVLISVPDQSHDATPSAESRANRSAAMQALVDNHRTFLRFLERRVGNRDTAEDLLQDAFGRAIEHLDELRENESIVAWFYRVLRNAVIDHYRRSDAAHRAAEAFARDFEEAVPPHDVHDAICACISDLARTLKPEYAEALRQIDVEGMPVKEFAERSGISAGNAGVRVFRAREALRRQVVASCGTCAEHGCVDCRCGRPR